MIQRTICICSLLVISSFACAQDVLPTASSDQVAEATLERMLSAMSVPADGVTDAIASGTVSKVPDGSGAQPFSVKLRGTTQYRYELSENEVTVIVANGPAAAVIRGARIARMSAGWALTARPPIFAPLLDVAEFRNPDVQISYVGAAKVGEVDVEGVTVRRNLSGSDPLANLRSRSSHTTFWISATTSLPVAIDFVRLGSTNPSLETHCRRVLSDYRQVQGIWVPFRQEEYIDGDFSALVQLTTAAFNQGLSDSEFVIPAATGAR